ncbi:MAG: hypothetical protein JWM05_3201 [Acidimicrobiales bacterium]|nr:hypothetical protein [Acidimicrobiales bacterium]
MTSETAEAASAPAGHVVLGRHVPSPVQVRAATAAMATWLAPLAAVQRLVADTGLDAMPTIGGRGMASVGLIRYLDNDLGDYHEIAVALVVRDTQDPKKAATLIRHLPVNQEFTCAAGRQIWGFPKFVADIDIDHGTQATTGTLVADGRHVLTLRVGRGPLRLPRRHLTLGTYSHLDGVLRRTPFTMDATGTTTRPGGAALVLGTDHPIADDLRALGVDGHHAIFTSRVAHLRATFGDAITL